MTERIYYTEPCRMEFDATVTHVETQEGRLVAVLDRTAFYPTSGGQPYDTGTLDEARVVDVFEREADEAVCHAIDRPLASGQAVHGRVDWGRRFDHMQQHTGQHLLSAACDRICQARTLSFHLGSASSTIDLDRDLAGDAIEAAAAEANRVVWENRPVSIRFVSSDEAARLPLRKEPVRIGTLRVVEIENFDLSACGGTHVVRTGAVGIIAISRWEHYKGGTRVEFVCGGRALGALRVQRDLLATCLRQLSVSHAELPAAIERLAGENRELKRTLRALQERLCAHEAGALAAAAEHVGQVAVVVRALEGYDAAGLKSLAAAIASRSGHATALLTAIPPMLVVVARAGDVPLDASAVLHGLLQRFGGRGGGKPELAQGGGLTGRLPEVLDAARAALMAALESRGSAGA